MLFTEGGLESGLAGLAKTIGRVGRQLGMSAKLMVGLPDYEQYLDHMEKNHPDQTPMDYASFFRNRQEARYGGGSGKASCC